MRLAAKAPAWLRAGGPPALFVAVYLCLFQPALVYKGNPGEFAFGPLQLGVPLLAACAALAALLLLFARILRRRDIGAMMLGGLALALWATGTFETASHGVLDGRSPLLLASRLDIGLDLARFVALVAAGAALARWKPLAMARLWMAMLAVHAAATVWIGVSMPREWIHGEDGSRIARFSARSNVLVLLHDALQSDVFARVLAADPRIAAAFDGFTFYPNAVSSAPTTYLSITAIHSGEAPAGGPGLLHRYHEAIAERSFMAQLAANGFDSMLVNPILLVCPRGTECVPTEVVARDLGGAMVHQAVALLNFAAFRTAPRAARARIYNQGRWRMGGDTWLGRANDAIRVLDRMAEEARPGNDRPVVRFLHLFDTHPPAQLGATCDPVHDTAWTRATAEAQAHCALLHTARLLRALRDRGLYDATAIVLLADHGLGIPNPGEAAFDLGLAASPTLAIKPFGAHGAPARSDALVGLTDVAATICAMTGKCQAAGGSDILAVSARPGPPSYPFLDYQWKADYFGADQVPIRDRYRLEGPPGQVGSWWRLSRLPQKPVTQLGFGPEDRPETLGLGWGGIEHDGAEDGRWAIGKEADIYVNVAKPADARLRLHVMTHGGNPAQALTVVVNEETAGTVDVGVTPGVRELPIPASMLRAGPNRVLFRFRTDNPPGARDARRLAVFFYDASLEPAAR